LSGAPGHWLRPNDGREYASSSSELGADATSEFRSSIIDAVKG
jgi:hypothetical protein